jgi:Aldehyde dehydrogenase family
MNRREGNLIWPLLLDHVRPDMRIAWEEPFGPVLPVIRIQSVEEGIHHCNASNFGLQVFSNSYKLLFMGLNWVLFDFRPHIGWDQMSILWVSADTSFMFHVVFRI